MKKLNFLKIILSTLLIFSIVLSLFACNNEIKEAETATDTDVITESSENIETEPETVEMSSLRVKSCFKSPQEVTLTREDADELLSLIPPGGWKRGITKSFYHYIFYLEDGRILYYTATTQNTTGMFNDQTNQRHIYINQTKTDWISNVLDKYFSD